MEYVCNNQHAKEDEDVNAALEKQDYQQLNFSKLNFSDKPMTTKESLREVNPIQWSKDVLSGKKEVVTKTKGE